MRPTTSSCIFLLATLLCVSPVCAQEPDGALCAAALRALSRGEPTTLEVSTGRLEAIELSPDGDASASRYVEREARIERSGRRIEFRNTYVCEAGMLALEQHRSLDPTEPSESFEPPLPVLAFPLEGTGSWSYSGIYVMDISGEKTRLPATGSGYLSGRTTADAGGAYLVHWQVRFGRSEMRSIASDTWLVAGSLRVMRRTLTDSEGGSFDGVGAAAATDSAGVTPGSEKKIIIILDPATAPNP